MGKIEAFESEYLRKNIPDFKAGDTVKVHVRVVEGERERIQVFQGTVIKRQGSGLQETFTVRKISFGVGTERTFPTHSPMLAKIEIKARGTVRRAKLYYLRERVGKKARVKEMFVDGGIPVSEEIAHSDSERKRLGLDEVVETEAEITTESEEQTPRADVSVSEKETPRNDVERSEETTPAVANEEAPAAEETVADVGSDDASVADDAPVAEDASVAEAKPEDEKPA